MATLDDGHRRREGSGSAPAGMLKAGLVVAGGALLPRRPSLLNPGWLDRSWLASAEDVTTMLARLCETARRAR